MGIIILDYLGWAQHSLESTQTCMALSFSRTLQILAVLCWLFSCIGDQMFYVRVVAYIYIVRLRALGKYFCFLPQEQLFLGKERVTVIYKPGQASLHNVTCISASVLFWAPLFINVDVSQSSRCTLSSHTSLLSIAKNTNLSLPCSFYICCLLCLKHFFFVLLILKSHFLCDYIYQDPHRKHAILKRE